MRAQFNQSCVHGIASVMLPFPCVRTLERIAQPRLEVAGLDVPWTQNAKLISSLDDTCRQGALADGDAIAAHQGDPSPQQQNWPPGAADMQDSAGMYGARQYGHFAQSGNVSPPAMSRVAGSDRHASHASSIETLLARMRALEERIEQLETDNAQRHSTEAKIKVSMILHSQAHFFTHNIGLPCIACMLEQIHYRPLSSRSGLRLLRCRSSHHCASQAKPQNASCRRC